MSRIGTITIDLLANSTRFLRDMGRSRRAVDTMNGAVRSLTSVAGGLGLALSGVGMSALIKNAIDAGDEIQKLSTRLGASSEALSQYKFVAEQTGVEFKALTMAWQRQTRRISEAAVGTGEAVKALDELGLSAKRLNDLSPEAQFEVLADALNGVASQQDKVRLAFKFWDSGGVKLLQTVNGGADAMRAMRMEADSLGLTLTSEDTMGLERASGAITNMKTAASALGNTLAVWLGPSIVELSKWFGNMLPRSILSSRGAISKVKAEIFSFLSTLKKFAFDTNQVFRNLLPKSGITDAIFGSEEEFNRRQKLILQDVILLSEKASAEFSKLIDIGAQLQEGFTLGKGAIEPRSELSSVGGRTPGVGKKKAGDAVDQKNKLQAQQNSLQSLRESLMSEEELIRESFRRRQQQILNDTVIGEGERTDLMKRAVLERDRAISSSERATNNARLTATSEFMGNMESVFADKNGKMAKSGQAFALFDIGIKSYQAAMSAYSAMAGIPVVGPGLGVAAAAAAVLAGLKNAAMVRSQKVPAFEDGGVIPRGRFGLVGEAGPELVKGPGEVISAKHTKQIMSEKGGPGVTNNFNFNIKSDSGRVTPESIEQLKFSVFEALSMAGSRG